MFLAIDIGGTNIQFGKMDKNNKLLEHWEVKTPNLSHADEFYDCIYTHSKSENSYKGIGVSVPGVILEDGGIASKAAAALHILFETNIEEELKKRFNLPVAALNDGKAAALCELHIGSAKGSQSSITFIIGTGIGGGITHKDEVLFGKDGFAGEFSSIPVFYKERVVQLTSLASATALTIHYNKESDAKVKEAKEVFERYHEGEEAAIKAMNTWLGWLGYAFRQLTVIYNPDVICIGGGVSNDPSLLDLLQKAYQKAMEPIASFATVTTELKLCSAPSQANLYGAILQLHNEHDLK